MASMFTQRGNILGDLDKQQWYKTFLLAKGYGQASATVLNHVTHARNTIGGAWFMLANGRNPFTSKFNEAFSGKGTIEEPCIKEAPCKYSDNTSPKRYKELFFNSCLLIIILFVRIVAI